MSWQTFSTPGNVSGLIKSEYLKLVPILALAFYMAFIPHINYPYAAHIDDWVHIAHSNAILQSGDVIYEDPFTGKGTGDLVTRLELGYHLPLAVFQRLSGIDWMNIARYFPSIVFMFTVLSVYIIARRLGFGWEAAFFTTLIPTTVGIMGPAFMVPVAMALLFIPFLFFLVFYYRSARVYALISMTIAFMVVLHAASAVLAVIIFAPFLLYGLKYERKHSLFVILALFLPFIVTLPWTGSLIMSEWNLLFVQKSLPADHDFLKLIQGYGYIPIVIGLLGTFALMLKSDLKSYSLVFGLVFLLVILAVYYTARYGIDLIYLRGLLFAMLLLGIIAGAGLVTLRRLEIAWLNRYKSKKLIFAQTVSVAVALIVVVVTLITTIPARLQLPYYHMIDKADYEAFVWIRDNVTASDRKAILDPWKATAFTAITGRHVYARTHMTTSEFDGKAYDFLRTGSLNAEFLRKNGISIIYTRVNESSGEVEYSSNNPDLVKLRENVYLLTEKP